MCLMMPPAVVFGLQHRQRWFHRHAPDGANGGSNLDRCVTNFDAAYFTVLFVGGNFAEDLGLDNADQSHLWGVAGIAFSKSPFERPATHVRAA